MNTRAAAVHKIHNAATRLFSERGARDISVSDLAEAAGVARGTIYNNISDPQALFDQVASKLLHDMHVRVGDSMRQIKDPASRIATGIRLFIRHAHEESAWGRFLVRFALSDDAMRQMLDEPPSIDLTHGLESGRFNMTPTLLPAVLALVGGTTLAAMQAVLSGRQTWRNAGEEVAALILMALGLPENEAHIIATAELPALAPIVRVRKNRRSA
jgi:AcrR family transcriptional regulator